MQKFAKIVCLFLSLIFFDKGISQNRHIFFQNLRENAGLPYHLVHAIDQDSLGQLWLATYNGVYRYDGYHFKAFQNNSKDSLSISSNLCQSILVSEDQKIWVGTNGNGLNILNPNYNQITKIPITQLRNDKGKKASKINHLVEDNLGNILMGSSAGLFKITQKEARLHINHISFPSDQVHLDIKSLFVDSEKKLWVGTNEGLLIYELAKDKWSKIDSSYFLIRGRISDIVKDYESNIWVGVCDEVGVYVVDPRNYKYKPYPYISNFSATDRVHLAFDFSNSLWVTAGRAGVFRHNLNTKQNDFFEGKDYEASPGNFSNYVRNPLVDQFGNVWFCGGGIHKWANTEKIFTHYSHPFSDYQATSCIYDDEDFLINGLWGNGISVWKKNSNEFYKLDENNGLFSNRIYKVFPLAEGIYIIAGQGGFQLLHADREEIIKRYQLPGTLFDIKKVGSKIYLGGTKGLWEWDKNNKLIKRLNKVNIRQFAVDDRSVFWIATIGQGLGKWDSNTGKLDFFQYQPGLKAGIQSNRVEHLDIDNKQEKIWAATAVGVESYDPATDSWELHTVDEKIAGIRVNAIHVYNDSLIWISNNQGISKLNLNTKNWVHYNTFDGLLNSYFYERVSFVNEEGRLFFGGRKGIVHFLPEDLKTNTIPPKLFFDEIKIENKIQYPLDPSLQEINLDWNDHFFEINFTGVHLTNPESISYKYRLLPQQKDWTTIKKQPLFFSEMNSGNYILEIIAVNHDGVFTKDPLRLRINIKGPFWKNGWFIGLITLFLTSIMLWFVWRYKRRIDRESQLDKKMNELKGFALRAQMNPHFIFNTMSSIQHFIINGEEAKALKYLSTLSHLIRKILYASSKDYILLEEEIEIIKSYVNLESLRFGQPIIMDIEIEENISIDSCSISSMVIQPIVENAIIHGLRPSPKPEKNIHIRVYRKTDNLLCIEIEDNGIGRAAASKKSKEHQSTGLQNIKDRLNLAGDYLDVKTDFQIIDLYNKANQATGTLVRMILFSKEL